MTPADAFGQFEAHRGIARRTSVNRGFHFQGLTPEGERVLDSARRIGGRKKVTWGEVAIAALSTDVAGLAAVRPAGA